MPSAQVQAARAFERGQRIRHLRLALAAPFGTFISQGRFGEVVAAEQGRSKAYDVSTAKRWEDGTPPEIDAIEAMVRIAHRSHLQYVSRAWLTFGPAGVNEAINAPPAPEIILQDIQVVTFETPRPVKPKDVPRLVAERAAQEFGTKKSKRATKRRPK